MPAKTHELTAEQKSRQEALKQLFEVYKHATTLSTGSIVLLATFLEKLFKSPKEVNLVTISLVSFIVSVITSWMMMAHLAVEQQLDRKGTRLEHLVVRILHIISPASFIAGVISLAVFAVINLSTQ